MRASHTAPSTMLSIDPLQGIRAKPVWQPTPEDVAARLRRPAAACSRGRRAGVPRLHRARAARTSWGNTHPRFGGWYMATARRSVRSATVLAAIANPTWAAATTSATRSRAGSSTGARRNSGPAPRRGRPARQRRLEWRTSSASRSRATRVRPTCAATARPPTRRNYASNEVHSCIQKALELLGVGNKALREVPVDAAYRMDLAGARSR